MLDLDRAIATPGAHTAAEWHRGLWVLFGFSLLGLAAALLVRETRERSIPPARAGQQRAR